MSWKFNIGNNTIEVVKRIEQKRVTYPLCDNKGEEIKSERGYRKTTYTDNEGTILSKTCRLIAGKPYSKFKRTEKVNIFREISRGDAEDLIKESCYYCKCDALKDYLKQKDNALKFLMVIAEGFKGYEAVLTTFQDRLIMYLGFGSITQKIQAIEQELTTNGKLKEEEVERANPEQVLAEMLMPVAR